MATDTKTSTNDLGSLTRKPGTLSEEREKEESSSEGNASQEAASDRVSGDGAIGENSASKEAPDASNEKEAEGDEGDSLSRPLGIDDSSGEGNTDDGSSITFTVDDGLHKKMQKRLMREHVSMKRALTGCITWWTSSQAKAQDVLQPYLDEVLREREEGSEEAEPTRTTSFKMDSGLHMEYRISLIDENLHVKDAVQAKVRWFCDNPQEVRRHIRGHLPPS